MDKETLIKMLENERSSVEFYNHKRDILRYLKGDSETKESRRKELKMLSMKELRVIGDKLGCKDTSKNDLVEEILIKEGI